MPCLAPQEKQQVFHLLLIKTFSVAVVFLLCTQVRAQLIYDLVDYSSLQNGWVLNGSVSVLASAPDDGTLNTAEIISWNWKATKGSLTVEGSSTGISPSAFSTANITATNILLGANSSFILTNDIPPDPGFGFSQGLHYSRYTDPFDGQTGSQYLAQKPSTGFNPMWNSMDVNLGGDPWVIAEIAPVPEPTSFAMFGVALVGMTRRRRQR